jgi:hypothetical protein
LRWLFWFLLAPQLFLLEGWLRALGGPPVDMAAALALFCILFAQPRALPGLLLGAAMARTVVEGGGLAVQVLVLGTPVALLLPLRGFLFGQRWLWQGLGAAVLAVAIPRLDGLYGPLFRMPGSIAALDGFRVVWSVLLLPPLVAGLRRVPPLRGFQEPTP